MARSKPKCKICGKTISTKFAVWDSKGRGPIHYKCASKKNLTVTMRQVNP